MNDSGAKRGKRGEQGVVLVLALFVIMILLVIVPQFRFSADIDNQLARNDVAEMQMEAIARAAIVRAQAALLVDLEDDMNEGGELGGQDGLGGGAGGGGMDGGSGGGGDGGGDGGGQDGDPNAGTHVDSLDEVWANGELSIQLGEESGFKTRIVISDEDSKLNLLLLFAEDENYRREWRDRFERTLDVMRDGEHGDLSLNDAGDLLDRVEKWMQGDRENEELTTAPLASGDWRSLLDRPVHAPLSLAEVCLIGGVRPTLLHGFASGEDDDRKWILGLEQVLTVWSNVEYAEEKAEDDSTKPPDVQNDQKQRTEAPGVNNGRVNVNTAPVCVLKSLFPDHEIPTAAWDRYGEFRLQQLEELKRQREELESATDDEKKDRELELDPEEATYPLKSIDDLRRVEGFSPDSSSITPERWNKLASYLTVESNVFSVTVMVGTVDLPRRYYVARAVLWRRDQGSESTCIPILPFERVGTSAVDMIEFSKEMDEWSETY